MGKREDNKLAKELEFQTLGGIQEQLKGSGWKKKHNSFFRKAADKFLCVSVNPTFEFDDSNSSMLLKVRYEVKPMGIDPIYWDIAQLTENKKKPLSFRAWGAFKAEPAYLHLGTTIGEPEKNTESVINNFINWLEVETKRIVDGLDQKPFSEVYLDLKSEAASHKKHAITLICALILEGHHDQALEIARKMAPSSFRNLFYKTPNDRVNFYELTILYLAGEEAFINEVREKPDSGFFERNA